jgi:hypothetical protein
MTGSEFFPEHSTVMAVGVRKRRRRAVSGLAAAITFALIPLVASVHSGAGVSAATRLVNGAISPRGVTLTAGSSVDLSLQLSTARPANFGVSLVGQPSGVTSTFACSSSRSCTLTLTAAASSPEATALVEVVMRTGTIARRVPIAVHVKPISSVPSVTTTSTTPPTPATTTTTSVPRTLSLRPESFIATNRPGSRSTFTINILRNGWTDPVAMTVEGLPASWRAAFLPNPALATTTLVFDSPVDSPPGEYPIRVSARSGDLVAESAVVVRLKAPEVFLSMVTVAPPVAPGGITRFVVNARSADDSARPISLRVEGLPSGATAAIAPNPASGIANIDVTVPFGIVPGNWQFQIVGSLDGVEVRLPAIVVVSLQYATSIQFVPTAVTPIAGQGRGYGLASASNTLTVAGGGLVAFDVNVTPLGGFADPITMTMVTPSGWSISWLTTSPNVVRVTLGPPSSASKGATALELRTSSGTLIANLSLTANVT